MRKIFFIAAAAAMVAAGAARADNSDYTSITVAQFLTICQTDTKTCNTDVTGVDTVAMLMSLTNKTDLGYCEPDNVAEADRTKAVIDWLNQHPDTASGNFYDSAVRAFKDIYPCTEATMPKPPPPVATSIFISKCKASEKFCEDEVTDLSLAVMFGDVNAFCMPDPDKVSTVDMTQAVVTWLKVHPELADNDYHKTVPQALKALWPGPNCPK